METELEITNRLGLHARAAAKLVHLASQFKARVQLVVNGEATDAKSILGILLLAAGQGTTVVLRCEGEDETEASAAIADLFRDRFGEPQ